MRRAAEITSFDDLSAAEYGVAVVQNGGLAGRYCALRRVKLYGNAAAFVGNRRCGLLRLPIANLGGAAYRFGRSLAADPVEVANLGCRRVQLVAATKRNRATFGVDAAHISALWERQAEAAVLPYGVVSYAAVSSENLAGSIDEIAARCFDACQPLYCCGVVAVGNKADILTVRLACARKIGCVGDSARIGLVQRTEREERVRKLPPNWKPPLPNMPS